jgi:prokaryotic ubiquitin-like protein Pup
VVRQQIERKRTHRRDDAAVEERDASESASHQALADEIDDILDEIDAVLEQNAEEFVRSYVQKGGE